MRVLLRQPTGCQIVESGTDFSEVRGEEFLGDCRDCFPAFAPDGALAAVASTAAVALLSTEKGTVLATTPEARVAFLKISPKGTYLVTMSHPDPKQARGNLAIFSTADLTERTRMVQSQWPAIEWTPDEQFAVRSVAGLLVVHDGALESGEAMQKLELQLPRNREHVSRMAPGGQPLLALFKPHNKQTQASCIVSRLPSIKSELFSVSFGRADDAALAWSPSGSALTVTVKKETDSSGKSYYGTSSLALLRIRDRTSVNITMPKGEAIHDCQWSPVAEEFIVVHGAMPRNHATLFNTEGTAIFRVGEAPRNVVHWSPDGHFFAMGGVGNLAGEWQLYHRREAAAAVIGTFTEKSSLQQWSPCSRYFLTSTVHSRLRVDNKATLWKHNGEKVAERKFAELHSADAVPAPRSLLPPPRAPSPIKAAGAVEKPKAYVPPKRSEGAAALLSRAPAAAGVKVKPAGPVGAQLAEEPKKKGKKR